MLPGTKISKTWEKYFLTKFSLVIISFALIAIQTMAQNGWTRKANTLHPRMGCCAAVVDNKIYVMGGIDGSLNNQNYNEVYDPMTDTWEVKQEMPTCGGLVSLAAVDSLVYAIGGGVGVPEAISEVFAYDPVSDTWNQKANLLSPRMGAAAGVVGGIIYNVGGNHYDRNCEAYNPLTDTSWTGKADIPENYGGVMVAPYNGLLYVIGGGFEITFSATYAYDPGTNAWTKKTNMPTARGWSHPAPVAEGKIYIIGGYTGVWEEILSDVEVYDPVDDSWLKLPDAPFNRTFFGATAVDDKIYIIGGTSDWATGSSEVWEFIPPSIFVKQPYVVKAFAQVNTDSVLFRTKFSNPDNLQFTTNLICTNSNGNQVDSVCLYDDGVHGDSLANDGLFAAYVPPQHNEDIYTLSVSVTESQSQNYRIIYDDCRFTTIGPLKIDSIATSPYSNFRYVIRPYIRNQGTDSTISNITVELYSDDPWVTNIYPSFKNCPDIMPGEVKTVSSGFAVTYDSATFPGYFNLRFEMKSNGMLYWIDTVNTVVTGIKNELPLPKLFSLGQNYPNPFNPSTKIKYSISMNPPLSPFTKGGSGDSRGGFVTLKVYDILGNEIETLVNEEKPTGSYELNWNATNLPSGVYFYQLMATPYGGQAGDFVQTRKMILIK